MAVEYAVQASPFILYDGENSAEILAAATAHFNAPIIVSEENEVLTLLPDPFLGETVLLVGHRLDLRSGQPISPDFWAEQFIVKA